ncbi:MAG: Maf family protein [Phycisphaerales bacterium]|nr:Maf family protein [Phycisphaerales bacterium]
MHDATATTQPPMTPGVHSAPWRSGPGAVLPRVYLASRSPRRRQILAEAGIEHDAAHPGLDDGELLPGRVPAARWAMALAFLKASSAARARAEGGGGEHPSAVVLGADTVVVKRVDSGLRIIGQPQDLEHACEILRLLRSGEHEVITGVALLDATTGRRSLFSDTATVRVGDLSDEAIAEYLAGGQWRGKAGGYNLSERLAAGWPISYEGDPTTVMGLPIRMLVPKLAEFARGGLAA